MIKRKKYILLWMILIFQCIVFIGCDSQYGEKEAFIINNTNKFEEKCKSQFGENTVLFDIKAGSTGNGDLIQQNRKVSGYLFGKVRDSDNNIRNVQYDTKTDKLYSDEKERLVNDSMEKIEQMGVESIYNADIYAQNKNSGLVGYFENGNSLKFEDIPKNDNLEHYLYDYDIIAIFFTDKFNQNITNESIIRKFFENNVGRYNILITIAEYKDKSDKAEKNMRLENWLGLINEIKNSERANKQTDWDWYFAGDDFAVLNKITIYDNALNENKKEYRCNKITGREGTR